MIVAKFGGTSVGSAEAMAQAARLAVGNPKIRLVVVSATSGTTNQLLRLRELKLEGKLPLLLQEIDALRDRHRQLARQLECDEETFSELDLLGEELEGALAGQKAQDAATLDELLSLGERLSSLLFRHALRREGRRVALLDARRLLRTDSAFGKAEPDVEETRRLCAEHLRPALASHDLVVTQGFLGADRDGRSTTLGRGGSDYSAALFAEALGAEEAQIWTDVPGILTMDPQVVPSAQVIPEISFPEAAEMANFGAKVLHPATLWPAIRARIPVFVGSTFRPGEAGTRILPEPPEHRPLIRAIALRRRQTLITIESLRMLHAHGFLARIFELLARHHLSVDLVTTSEVSVALTIDGTAAGSGGRSVLENRAMLAELESFATVKVEEDLSLVAVIGNGLTHTAGVAARAFHALSEFNVRLVCHGASEHNLCFLVSSREAEEVAKRLHHVCIEWRKS